MSMFQPGRSSMLLLGLFLVPAFLLWATQKEGQTTSPMRNPLKGTEIFQHYCASCHGVDGRGHGPASVALKHGAPRNGGQFPFQRVKEIIEGKEPGLLAHGSREMPVWGPIFHEIESDMDLGEVRLDAVTKTVEAMQQNINAPKRWRPPNRGIRVSAIWNVFWSGNGSLSSPCGEMWCIAAPLPSSVR